MLCRRKAYRAHILIAVGARHGATVHVIYPPHRLCTPQLMGDHWSAESFRRILAIDAPTTSPRSGKLVPNEGWHRDCHTCMYLERWTQPLDRQYKKHGSPVADICCIASDHRRGTSRARRTRVCTRCTYHRLVCPASPHPVVSW